MPKVKDRLPCVLIGVSILTEQMVVTIIMVMAKKVPFVLVYADEVKDHLRAIETKYHSLVESEVEGQLLHEPDVETRNRKPLKKPMAFKAEWELRFGPPQSVSDFLQGARRGSRPAGVWRKRGRSPGD